MLRLPGPLLGEDLVRSARHLSPGDPVPELRFHAWAAPATATASAGAVLALCWAGLRMGGLHLPTAVDAFLGTMGLLLTALATVLPPLSAGGRATPSWGVAAGLAAAALWAAGGVRRWRLATRAAHRAERGTGFGQP